ncbi:MAG: DciA family protein [Phycisphaeraceae bacterium JB051]
MDSQQKHLDNLRQWRNFKGRDVSMGFLDKWFKSEVGKPFKQMGNIGQAWAQLVPTELLAKSRLERFYRGTLTVTVDSSATLYALDRELRSGLQKEIAQASRPANLSLVKLVVGTIGYQPQKR